MAGHGDKTIDPPQSVISADPTLEHGGVGGHGEGHCPDAASSREPLRATCTRAGATPLGHMTSPAQHACLQQLAQRSSSLHGTRLLRPWPTRFHVVGADADGTYADGGIDQGLLSVAYDLQDYTYEEGVAPPDCLTSSPRCSYTGCDWYTLGGWQKELAEGSTRVTELLAALRGAYKYKATVMAEQDQITEVEFGNVVLNIHPMGASHRAKVSLSHRSAQLRPGYSHRLSAIFCVVVGDSDMNSNVVRFSDPRPQAAPMELRGWLAGTSVFEWQMTVGQVIFFPSHLRHHMPVNGDEQARVFITADVYARNGSGTGGDRTQLDGVHLATSSMWATPVFQAVDGDLLERNGDLAAGILQLAASQPSVSKSNKGGWQSRADLFRRSSPSILSTLQNHTYYALKTFLERIEVQTVTSTFDHCAVAIDIQLSWANVNRLGNSNAPHTHPASTISGVYYVSNGGDDQSHLHFINPCSGMVLEQSNACEVLSVKTEPGSFVLFPSWLEHFVDPHRGEGERISVSFNAVVRRLTGTSELTLTEQASAGLDSSVGCKYFVSGVGF